MCLAGGCLAVSGDGGVGCASDNGPLASLSTDSSPSSLSVIFSSVCAHPLLGTFFLSSCSPHVLCSDTCTLYSVLCCMLIPAPCIVLCVTPILPIRECVCLHSLSCCVIFRIICLIFRFLYSVFCNTQSSWVAYSVSCCVRLYSVVHVTYSVFFALYSVFYVLYSLFCILYCVFCILSYCPVACVGRVTGVLPITGVFGRHSIAATRYLPCYRDIRIV